MELRKEVDDVRHHLRKV